MIFLASVFLTNCMVLLTSSVLRPRSGLLNKLLVLFLFGLGLINLVYFCATDL